MPPIVELLAVSKNFSAGCVHALDAITLSAAAGDFISLIGPSGSGKSTLLRLIAGIAEPSSGSVRFECSSPQAVSGKLAYVFQEPALLPWLDVTRNIQVPLALSRVPVAQRSEIAQRVLAWVRLTDKATAYPRELSGGQKMRVSLARALAVSPQLLLLDEPFGALDEMTRDHLNEELLALRQLHAWTAFFVTHSVPEAVFLSNRIIILSANPGRIAHEIPIDLPYPRNALTRLTPEYHLLVSRVSTLLRSIDAPA